MVNLKIFPPALNSRDSVKACSVMVEGLVLEIRIKHITHLMQWWLTWLKGRIKHVYIGLHVDFSMGNVRLL